MKKFKELVTELAAPAQDYEREKDDDQEVKGYKPRSKGEQDFANMHNVTKINHPVAKDNQFTGEIEGNPDHHVGGKKQAKGEDQPVKQGSSDEQAKGQEFKSPKQYGRGGEKAPVQQGSSKIKEGLSFGEFKQTLDEGVTDTLKKIVDRKQAMPIKFKNNKTLKVDMQTANKLLAVHNALKPANAKKFRDALEKGETSFMSMVDFAMQNA